MNEKTLELNITHEILHMCRQFDPLACAIGLALIQEKDYGYDSRTLSRFPLSWFTSPLQYKSAKRRISVRPNTFHYAFYINNNKAHDQHRILYNNLAGGQNRVAYYALPAVHTTTEFVQSLPQLLDRTFFLDVTQISPRLVDGHTHRLILDPQRQIAIIQSEEIKVKVISAKDFQNLVAERKIGLSISQMLENLKRPPKEDFVPKSKRPRFLFTMFSPVRQIQTQLPKIHDNLNLIDPRVQAMINSIDYK